MHKQHKNSFTLQTHGNPLGRNRFLVFFDCDYSFFPQFLVGLIDSCMAGMQDFSHYLKEMRSRARNPLRPVRWLWKNKLYNVYLDLSMRYLGHSIQYVVMIEKYDRLFQMTHRN